MRAWKIAAVIGLALVALGVAGKALAPPPPAPPPAATRPADLRPSCEPGATTPRPAPVSDGPELRPPVKGLRLDPADPRAGDLTAARAGAIGRRLVTDLPGVIVHARSVRMTLAPSVRARPAWAVAVSGAPAGMGFCGPVGSREVVVLLDAVSGAELFRYSYR